jgi:hypothetical protein
MLPIFSHMLLMIQLNTYQITFLTERPPSSGYKEYQIILVSVSCVKHHSWGDRLLHAIESRPVCRSKYLGTLGRCCMSSTSL